jgi:O-antigen ligase/tetratricopeptide (TPR) repeat protein
MEASAGSVKPTIAVTVTLALTLAIAPWFSGGREPLAMVISAVGLLLAVLLLMVQPEVRRPGWSWLGLSYMALIGWGIVSLTWSANRYSSALWVAVWVMAALVFMVARALALDDRSRGWLLGAYVASAVIFAAVGIGMYVIGSYERLTGTFYWPNPAAAYLLPAVLLALDGLKRGAGRRRLAWLGAGAVLLAAMVLTDSRAALLLLVILVSLYLAVSPGVKRFWIHFVFMLVIAIAVIALSNAVAQRVVSHRSAQVPGSRLAELASGDANSTTDRIFYLRSAWMLWLQRPVLGTGAGTFGDRHPAVQERVISASNDVHNIYVQTLSELGLVGLSLLLLVILGMFGGVIRGLLVRPQNLAVVLGVVALVLHAAVDIDAKFPALLALAALLAAVAYRPWRDGVGAWPRWTLAPAAALLMLSTCWYWSGSYIIRAAAAQADGDYDLASQWDHRAQLWVTNPDVISAEGIMWYARAAVGDDPRASLDKALGLARRAERADPYDGQHYQLEGRVRLAERQPAAAIKAFEAALRRDPFNHPEYALDLAGVQRQTGHTDQALHTAQAMLALYSDKVVENRSSDPGVRPAVANLEAFVGNIELQRGQRGQAKEAAERAVRILPESLAGRALMHQVSSQPE